MADQTDRIAAYDAAWERVHTACEAWNAAQFGVATFTLGTEPAPLRPEQIKIENECATAWSDYIAARNAVFGLQQQ